ncbi:MAG: exodeoxyribonuclease III [Candidatus Tokpelaia sp. JSC085]|nr:MAG: exodeoxyribonuclease III [Candidatus Tokpelaia sp. JSC085]
MRIATWNVNGIRARMDNLVTWLRHSTPDIVCLQETKSTDEQFPRAPIEAIGYHVRTYGQKGFNGVALLSRMNPDEINCGLPGDVADKQARLIEGVYSTDKNVMRVVSLYLPNGNPVQSNKYTYKLSWMKRLCDFAASRLRFEELFILAGDYNVIATDMDAKNPINWVDNAFTLSSTRAAFRELINLGLTDAIRAVSSDPEYTFWDYQAQAWPKNDGIRIDYLLLSPEALDKMTHAFVQKKMRGWERASDHVPVCIDFSC